MVLILWFGYCRYLQALHFSTAAAFYILPVPAPDTPKWNTVRNPCNAYYRTHPNGSCHAFQHIHSFCTCISSLNISLSFSPLYHLLPFFYIKNMSKYMNYYPIDLTFYDRKLSGVGSASVCYLIFHLSVLLFMG